MSELVGPPGIGHNFDSLPLIGSRPRLAIIFCRFAKNYIAPAFDSRHKQSRFACCVPPSLRSVGPPGIEPGLHAPEACVLPAYSGPPTHQSSICFLLAVV